MSELIFVPDQSIKSLICFIIMDMCRVRFIFYHNLNIIQFILLNFFLYFAFNNNINAVFFSYNKHKSKLLLDKRKSLNF